MKKILLLIIPCFLLTGCTINYNLKIEDNKFTETLKGNVLNSEIKINEDDTDVNIIYELNSKDQHALIKDNNSIYQKTISKNNDSFDYIYRYTYNKETINNSRILNECFEKFSFEEKDNIYYLMTEGMFYCDYAEKININITTDYKINYHNATETNKNTYSWTIDNNNKENFELYMAINKSETNSKSTWSTFKIICLIVLLLLSAICLLIIRKKEQY